MRLTLLGHSLLLAFAEVSVNIICWIVAAVLFGRNKDTRPILSLALLAWTLGLRHALDADHISAIDNATRGLVNLGQLPVTCGLFFSLGHSTIVIVVTVAIAISSSIYEKLQRVGNVGGIIGAAVSGSFLFIVGLANSIILWRIIKHRCQDKKRAQRLANGETLPPAEEHEPEHNHMLMMRILGPLVTFVNRPWKMYPVGVLFGLGFDTASSIALLAVSALAKKGTHGTSIPSSYIVILPLLFTAGMTLIDSTDSILMLYSYTGFPEHSWSIFDTRPSTHCTCTTDQSSCQHKIVRGSTTFERTQEKSFVTSRELIDDNKGSLSDQEIRIDHTEFDHRAAYEPDLITVQPTSTEQDPTVPPLGRDIPLSEACNKGPSSPADLVHTPQNEIDTQIERINRVKLNVMSGLSIILTLMSILVAFSISLITIMGLIGEQCSQCVAAAESEDGGGLAGSWWRGWAKANDNSGFIGVAIVGSFVLVVAGWYGFRWVKSKANMGTAWINKTDAP